MKAITARFIRTGFILVVMLGSVVRSNAQTQEEDWTIPLWLQNHGLSFNELKEQVEAYYANRDKGRGSGYSHWIRYERQLRDHQLPNGKTANASKIALDEFSRYEATNPFAQDRSSNTGNWSLVGPTDYVRYGDGYNGGVGRVNCIAFHPSDPNTIFCGTPAGGLWKSSDLGSSWVCLTDGLPSLGIADICLHPTDPNIIYILTGDSESGTPDAYGNGVLKSLNGGLTWHSTGLSWNLEDRLVGRKMIMDMNKPDTLLVGTTAGVFRTTNGGLDWTQTSSNPGTNDLEFKPGNTSIVYMATDSKIYRSSNNGQSWTDTLITFSINTTDRIELAVSAADPEYLFAVVGPNTDTAHFKGVYVSSHSGDSFVQKANYPNILGYANDGNDNNNSQSWYDLAIACNPVNSSDIYVGGINIWRSVLKAEPGSFVNITQWKENLSSTTSYCHADVHDLVFSPYDNALFACTDGGLYRSTDQGNSFTKLSVGMNIMQFYNIASHESSPNRIIGGTQDNGTNLKNTNSTTWKHVSGADASSCAFSPSDPTTFYGTKNGIVFRSTDNGISTVDLFTIPNVWPTLLTHPVDGQILFVGSSTRVIRSLDGGSNFLLLSSTTPGSVAMAIGINDPNILYSTNGVSLKIIHNALTDFSPGNPTDADTISPPLAYDFNARITDIAVNPLNANQVAVTVSGYVPNHKVFRSMDAGQTWENISGSLPNIPFLSIAWHPGGSDGLYVGADVGVYYRDDELGDWLPFRNGLPHTPINDLAIHTASGKLRAGTFGRSVWETDLYRSCTDEQTLVAFTSPQAGYWFYQADQTIVSAQSFDGGLGTSVRYQAGRSITLTPGFEVKQFTPFDAVLQPCATPSSAEYQDITGTYAGPLDGILSSITSVEEKELSNHFLLFPNPSSYRVNLEFEMAIAGSVSIDLTDLSGRTVAQLIANRTISSGMFRMAFDVTEFSAGTYLVKLQSPQRTITQKLIIQ
ncbi:MAG: T9SS type A sorting domain-containing protein [Flavobacteriales bacterium]|nr:T9SS type A sorting domain-containing protein [Flavobacteriales bacterium]